MTQTQALRQLLSTRNTRNLLLAYLITYLGTAMAPIAMAFGVLELTQSSQAMSVVMASMTVATIVVLLIGGVVADRYSRRRVLFWAELSAMGVQAVIAFLFLSQQAAIASLAILMFLNGIALGFNAPAAMGLVPELVPKERLQAFNSLLGMARNTAMILGAAIGGLLVSSVGAGWTIAIDSLSFGLSALLVFFLQPSLRPHSGHTDSIWLQLKEGWTVFRSFTWLWVIVVQFAFVLSAYQSVITVLGPVVSQQHYEGASSWGLVMAAMSIGLLLGGIIALNIRPKYPMRFASFCVFSAALIPLSLSIMAPVWVVALAAFINGVCWELFGVIWVSTLQRKIAPNLLSRISAYDYIGSIALVPIGIILIGYMIDGLGQRLTGLLAMLLIVAATIAVLLVPSVWRMQTVDVASSDKEKP